MGTFSFFFGFYDTFKSQNTTALIELQVNSLDSQLEANLTLNYLTIAPQDNATVDLLLVPQTNLSSGDVIIISLNAQDQSTGTFNFLTIQVVYTNCPGNPPCNGKGTCINGICISPNITTTSTTTEFPVITTMGKTNSAISETALGMSQFISILIYILTICWFSTI